MAGMKTEVQQSCHYGSENSVKLDEILFSLKVVKDDFTEETIIKPNLTEVKDHLNIFII